MAAMDLDDAAIMVDELAPAHRSLRIALVTETYPPEINGVATTLAHVVEGLRRRNHQLQLIRPRQKDAAGAPPAANADHEVLMRGMPVPRYPHLKMGLPAKKRLVALWARQRPDLVHIATEGPLGWSALQAARHLRLPVTSDFRTNFQEYSRHYGIGWLSKPIVAYLRKFHNHTQCTMVPTEALRRDLLSLRFDNVRVVARGVDAQRFHPTHRSDALRAQWGASDQTLVVLHVGRLAPEKNLGLLLESFEAMRRVHADARLVLVGDGPARKDIARRCPQAVFAGLRSGHDLAAHYASGDVFVFPSTTETFGNVTQEAMASGLPVLAYDYAAAAQLVVSGANGWLAPLGAPAEFVRLAQRAVEDPLILRGMGLHARQCAAARDWERIIEQIEEVMLQALDLTAPGATRVPARVAHAK